jgi:hypothetical protein
VHPLLRSVLPRGYAGFTEATAPRHLVLPATTSVPLVVQLLDSAHRPPAFVMGAYGASSVLEGACAPSYLEVLLAPLGAYTLLGLPMDQPSGQTIYLAPTAVRRTLRHPSAAHCPRSLPRWSRAGEQLDRAARPCGPGQACVGGE